MLTPVYYVVCTVCIPRRAMLRGMISPELCSRNKIQRYGIYNPSKAPLFNLTNSITLNHPSPSTIFLQKAPVQKAPVQQLRTFIFQTPPPQCNSHAHYPQHSAVSSHCRSSMSRGLPSRCPGLRPQYPPPVPRGLIPQRSACPIRSTHVCRAGMYSCSNYSTFFCLKKGSID